MESVCGGGGGGGGKCKWARSANVIIYIAWMGLGKGKVIY